MGHGYRDSHAGPDAGQCRAVTAQSSICSNESLPQWCQDSRPPACSGIAPVNGHWRASAPRLLLHLGSRSTDQQYCA